MNINLESLAHQWIAAFNEKDLETLLSLYDENAKHYSPKLKLLEPETQGLIIGKAALYAWWKGAFERLPNLKYTTKNILHNNNLLMIEYIRMATNEPDMMVAELYEIQNGKIIYSRVYHS